MAENSNIEWTDHTFNTWWGCTKVSQGCKNCYADRDASLYGFNVFGPTAARRFFGEKYWAQPLKWDADAEKDGVRRRVFCASMADVFEGPETCTEADAERQDRARLRLFCEVIPKTPNLDWLILTKRPENVCPMLNLGKSDALISNIWIGTSCEDQSTAEERIPHLLNIPAKVRFLSCEPLLGPIDLTKIKDDELGANWNVLGYIDHTCGCGDGECSECWQAPWASGGIHWVIAGGESGPKARPMHPDWARSLRDQCADANVTFFFKQWGEWLPDDRDQPNSLCGRIFHERGIEPRHYWPDGTLLFRVGKKRAGSLLDGKEHKEWPKCI